MSELRLETLTKHYSTFSLGPLSLEVGAEVVGVLGPSGSGKTTLLSLVAGTEPPTAGTVRVNGAPLSGRALETRGTARVFQESALFPHLTARENVQYAAAAPDEIEPLAGRLEIDDILDQTASTLSGGEGRRVEVARALAADPEVLLLDEPTAGLDTPVRQRLRGHLRELFTALDIPILYVTHNQQEAARVADRIVVLREGEVQQQGPPTDVFRRPETPFVARFTGTPNVLPARRVEGEAHVFGLAEGIRVTLARPPETTVQTGWLCIRPEEIDVGVEADDHATNVLAMRVEDCVFEGGAYTLTLRARSPSSFTLQAKVLPPTYRGRDLEERADVHVHLPPEALHVIPR